MTLDQLKVGQDAILRTIGGEGELRHHLLDMGLTPGTEVTLRKVAPMGDPIELELRGYELTLRLADAAKIEVDHVHETDRAARDDLMRAHHFAATVCAGANRMSAAFSLPCSSRPSRSSTSIQNCRSRSVARPPSRTP